MRYAVIAAGEGSRLKQEGIEVPKPLVTVGGETLLGRLIRVMRSRSDCENISIVLNPAVEAWADANGAEKPWLEADNVITASTPGSMHSLALLGDILGTGDGQFCLTTVDTVFPEVEFGAFLDYASTDDAADGCMGVTTYVDDEKPLYVAADHDSLITGFFDSTIPSARYVSGGIYVLPSSSFAVLDDCMSAGLTRMRQFQRALVASGMTLRAWPFSRIIDVDHAADIEAAETLIGTTHPANPLPTNI